MEYRAPEDLPDDQRVLLEQARDVIKATEDKMLALVRAASERWRPMQSTYQTDETDAPVFSDDEYAAFLANVDHLGECSLVMSTALFMGLPEEMVKTVILEKLRTKIAPLAGKGGVPFIVRRGTPRDMD